MGYRFKLTYTRNDIQIRLMLKTRGYGWPRGTFLPQKEPSVSAHPASIFMKIAFQYFREKLN